MSNRNFINQVGRFAQDDFQRSGIFPSVKIAQAILESSWGKSELAQKANNLFGIKGTWDGNSYKVRTREEDANGRSYYVNADFRKYPSVKESIEDHSDFFTSTPWRTSNYQPVLNSKSYQEQARALQSSGYATDKQYANKLINLIESNNLDSWDDTGGNNVSLTIAISRGHGGFGVTPGKRSPAGEYEWHFNDKVADAFEAEIQKYQNVQLLRVSDPSGRTDTPLLTRTNRANNWRAGLYVAFHHNANTGRWGNWSGSEVWVRPGAPQAASLARMVAPAVSKAMNIQNRGVKAGNLHEVREPNQLAILIEGGFMDSRIDITAMRRNDMLAAQGRAVATQVARYFKLKRKSGSSSTSSSKPSTASKKATPKKISGSTYTVKRGDTLFSISKRSGKSVNNLKSWNNLKGNTIKTGQTLRLTKPTSKKSTTKRKTGGVKNIQYSGDWKFNKNTNVYYVPVKAKYTLAYDTYAYDKLPKAIRANRLSKIKAGTPIDVVELCRFVEPNNNQSYVWAVYRTGKGRLRYLPIKKWNKRPGRVTNSGLWGRFH